MTLQDPKRHHFIPQFYLRAWARGDGRLTWFYRPHSKVEAVSRYPKAVGFDTNLYAYEGVPEDKRQILEKELFHPVDTHAAETHKLLLGGKLNALSNENRVHWARFLLSTQLRTPFGLQELKRLADQTLRANLGVKNDAEFNALRKLGDPETIYEWTQKYQPQVIENAHKQFLPGLIDHEDLGHYLINMQWATVGLAHASQSLLTADRPFVSTHGWKDPNAVLLFPLSPRCLFVATNSAVRTSQIASKPASPLVKTVNDMVVRTAFNHVFGNSEEHVLFIERRLRHHNEEPIPGPVGKGRPGCPAD
jgi:hypothetical protein